VAFAGRGARFLSSSRCPQGLLILYHLGRRRWIAELSLELDAISNTRTPLPTQTTTYHINITLSAYASLLRLSLHTVIRLTISGLRPSGYSYRPHLHLRLSTANCVQRVRRRNGLYRAQQPS
jgi:hypothetical protein